VEWVDTPDGRRWLAWRSVRLLVLGAFICALGRFVFVRESLVTWFGGGLLLLGGLGVPWAYLHSYQGLPPLPGTNEGELGLIPTPPEEQGRNAGDRLSGKAESRPEWWDKWWQQRPYDTFFPMLLFPVEGRSTPSMPSKSRRYAGCRDVRVGA
jgi:hypothetical protein